jgi:hypothetical protein
MANSAPYLGLFVGSKEGLCAWSQKDHRFVLVYPMSALRFLYCQCNQVMLAELAIAEMALRRFLEQELVLRFQFQSRDDFDLVRSNPSGVVEASNAILKEFGVRTVMAVLMEEGSQPQLELRCVREPQLPNAPLFVSENV